MSRLVSAGVACLGIIALSIALSRGEEGTGQADQGALAAGVGDPQPQEVLGDKVRAAGDLVEIQIGSDSGISAGSEGLEVTRPIEITGEEQEIVEVSPDGKIIQKHLVPANVHYRAAFKAPLDPATREALEKMIAGLKDEAKRLSSDGKQEEADQKLRSAATLGRALTQPRWFAAVPGGKGVRNRLFVAGEDARSTEDIHKLRESAKAMAAQISQLKREGKADEAAKLERELAELKKKSDESLQRWRTSFTQPGVPGQPGNPFGPHLGYGAPGEVSAPGAFGPGGWGQPGHFPPPVGFGLRMEISPEAGALMHKAEALRQAAAKLKEAGLEEQSQKVAAQAEKMHAEAQQLREQAARAAQAAGGGPGAFPGGPPPGEVLRSIHELQEQVQLLRKEVGELRELLQKK